jgi:excisionase family DNA binding protein
MSFEETLAVILEAKLAPVCQRMDRLAAEMDALRRSIPPVLVSKAEAARKLGVSISTVQRRVRDGSLPIKMVGKSVRIDLSGLHGPPGADVEAEVVRLRAAPYRAG